MRMKLWVIILLVLMLLSLLISIEYSSFAALGSMIFVILLIMVFFALYERSSMSGKELAVIAMLGTFSAAARVPFAALPNVQPSTFIILVSGYVFGPFAGFVIGAETAFLSNFFLGQGPWTPWQMLAWGTIGTLGWLFRKLFGGRKHEFYAFLALGFLSGYLYGVMMNLWYWLAFIYPHTIESFLMVEATSFWFDTLHGLGNVVFIDLFAVRFIKILERYRLRFGIFSKTPAQVSS